MRKLIKGINNVETVTLRDHIESKIAGIEKAVKIATDALEKRLGGMNEFRESLKDQAAKFITRDEMNARFESLDKNKKDNTTLILAALGVIISFAALIAAVWKN